MNTTFEISALLLLAVGVSHAQWAVDCSTKPIPNTPVRGSIMGQPFMPDRVEISHTKPLGKGKGQRTSWFLKLRQGGDFFADKEFMLFLLTPRTKGLDNRTFVVGPAGTFSMSNPIRDGNVTYPPVQGLHISVAGSKGALPKTDMSSKFTMKLIFGKTSGATITGKLYLCVADVHKSWVAGEFTAILPVTLD